MNRGMGAVINLLMQEAEIALSASTSNLRRDLEIRVREQKAFAKIPTEKKENPPMLMPKKRLSAGRRVLVGHQSHPGTVISVSEQPGQMGEFFTRFFETMTDRQLASSDPICSLSTNWTKTC